MNDTQRVIVGDCRNILLPDESVHLVVTSPPYWSLRDYGVDPSVWGGDPECAHEWGTAHTARGHEGKQRWVHIPDDNAARFAAELPQGTLCARCGAWLGALGLEPTPELYIEHLVECCREIRRVLRPDGVCMLNLGDSYASGGLGGASDKSGLHGGSGVKPHEKIKQGPIRARSAPAGTKPKQKLLVPHRAAIALQADGWWCRADIPWAKRNGMPESVTDRPAVSHEYWFLLTRSPRYYWDADAIRAPYTQAAIDRSAHMYGRGPAAAIAKSPAVGDGSGHYAPPNPAGRNFRTSDLILDDDGEPLVLVSPTQGFPGAHFATFPERVVLPWVLAGSPQRACGACGAPWVRATESEIEFVSGSGRAGNVPRGKHEDAAQALSGGYDIRMGPSRAVTTVGWDPPCDCEAEPIPGTVLDPFAGAGTVGVVCAKTARSFIGIELKPSNAAMASARIHNGGTYREPTIEPDQLDLFAENTPPRTQGSAQPARGGV
jgi:DNA modification methylase